MKRTERLPGIKARYIPPKSPARRPKAPKARSKSQSISAVAAACQDKDPLQSSLNFLQILPPLRPISQGRKIRRLRRRLDVRLLRLSMQHHCLPREKPPAPRAADHKHRIDYRSPPHSDLDQMLSKQNRRLRHRDDANQHCDHGMRPAPIRRPPQRRQLPNPQLVQLCRAIIIHLAHAQTVALTAPLV
jgi:hypothetical protein